MALYAYPLVYVFTTSALDLISTEMEDAASIHGAGKYTTLWKVSLPLALPAILAASLLIFLETIALVGTPALIAIPAGFSVITTQLAEFFQFPLRVEVAAAYAMSVLLVTALLLIVQRRLLARRGYVSVSGKGGARRPLDVGPLKWVLFGYSLFIAALTVIMPVVMLLVSAFSKVWTHGLSADNLTLQNFVFMFTEQSTVLDALQNTFVYSSVAAIACALLGLVVAYVSQRRLLPFSGVVPFIALTPIAVPGIVLAIGIYGAYAGPPFYLYGSGFIIILAFVTRFLPIAAVSSTAAIRSLNPELEDAVRILGGSRLLAMRVVIAPLLKKTLIGTGILIFIIASRELSTAIFLTAPDSRVASVLTLDLSEQGNYEVLSAMGIVLVLMTSAAAALGMKLAGRDFMVRRG
jgi:iron(III) transport system permease protein